jgi:ribonuclease HI
VAAINSIPISLLSQPDVQVWRGTSLGDFLVKSVYHLAIEIGERSMPGGSAQKEESALWKTMWKLQLPNATKIFFWRACHNLLPTKDNLLRRRVVKEPMCPICEREPETVVHAFWTCSVASDVWGSSHKLFQKFEKEGSDFMHIVNYMLRKGGVDILTIFVNLARQIWTRRNSWVHEGHFTSLNAFLKKSDEFIVEYKKANERSRPMEHTNSVDRGKTWTAPNSGWMKANWDMAINKDQDRVDIGVIIRDEKGRVVVAMSRTRQGLLEPTTGEALGAFQATRLIMELGLQNIILEEDAKQIVEAINSTTSKWSRFEHLVDNTQRLLCSLSRWKCVFIHWEANEAAHRLAKAAVTDISDIIWRGEIPNCISDIVLMEQLALSSDS